MSAHDPEHVHQQVKIYKRVFWALMVLTVLTVLASYAPFGAVLALVVGLAIAFLKGGLVASFFMHLSSEKKWIYGILLLTLIFFIVLFVLPIATSSDTFGTKIHYEPAHKADGHGDDHGAGH